MCGEKYQNDVFVSPTPVSMYTTVYQAMAGTECTIDSVCSI